MAHLGMSGLKDHELMRTVRERDFSLVTNNAVDFRRIFQCEPIHAGLVIIVPNVSPDVQRALLARVLEYVGEHDLVNTAVEIDLKGDIAEIETYEIPTQN